LFPLPNLVLLPRAILPLHIFEERYKQMTADALGGDRRVAMALLKPGWEQHYYGRPAIEPVVCVGNIVSHERLPDGKYNFLLQGSHRARVIAEQPHDEDRLYRLADVELLVDDPIMEIDLANERGRLTNIFSESPFDQLSLGRQLLRLLASPMPTEEVADVLAFNLLEDVALKQSLLAETDPCRRVARVLAALDNAKASFEARSRRQSHQPSVN
jgi:Lon protease-like protein